MIGADYLGIYRSSQSEELFYTCASIYFTSFGLSYFYRNKLLVSSFARLTDVAPNIKIDNITKLIAYLALLFSFVILINVGSGGLMWITDPRLAYLNFRGATGDGALYVFVQWMLTFSLVINLPYKKVGRLTWLFIILLHCLLGYFLGSKQVLITLLVYSLFFYDNKVQRLKLIQLIVGSILGVFIFLITLSDGDIANSLGIASIYISEYYINTTLIFENGIKDYFWNGQLLTSTIWTYLPRFMFPDKPYEYGVVLINSIIFPGAAERGQTPGLINWSQWYVDFGFVGIFIFGFFRGVFESSIYSVMQYKNINQIKLGFLFGISITPIYLYAPIFYQYLFIIFMSYILLIFNFLNIKILK